MALELANDNVVPNVDGADVKDLGVSNGADHALPNGTHESLDSEMQNDVPPNHEAFAENSALPPTKQPVNGVADSSAVPDANLPDHDLTETSAGIAPVADFIPKDAPNLSHPTPPPDQPLTSGAADVDTEMQDQPAPDSQDPAPESVVPPDAVPADAAPSKSAPAETAPADSSAPATVEAPSDFQANAGETLLNGISDTAEPTPDVDAKPATSSSTPAESSGQQSLVRPREEDEEEEPAAKRTRVEKPDSSLPAPTAQSESQDAKPAPVVESQLPVPASEAPSQPVAAAVPAVTADSSERPNGAQYSMAPITPHQKMYLIEKLKNNKKTKHAAFFTAPVDYVKLNIPTYPDVIKKPMDLGTMENKLKNNEYPSLQAFGDDFHQIIDNTEKFNGLQHVVTHAGHNMRAYFEKFMQQVPSPDQKPSTSKSTKKNSPAPPRPAREKPKPAPPPPPPAPERSNSEAFALHPDGTPQIRRDSQAKRPARAIKPPPSREVTYPKPKRKEHQLELKFCEHVLDEARSPRFSHVNHVFLMPVDPVALNIPHYRQIIKNPMDMSTMAQKLKQGQYGKASEFKRDFELMIENCLIFNPIGNPVRDLGIEMRRVFEGLWAEKPAWERKNRPKSSRASSASADESAGEESEEEDDDEPDGSADAKATIAALSKQLAMMQNQLANINQGNKPAKNKKAKDIAKTASKRKSLASSVSKPAPAKAAPKPAPKPKKQRPVSYDDKQEISSAVEKMTQDQIETLTQIITENCAKYREMGDEMELEIDDLPEDVQRLLLKHVRSIFGNPNRASARAASPDDVAAMDDDDFEPSARAARASGGGGGRAAAAAASSAAAGGDSKRKKHKPMGKKEQQDSINALRSKLAAFSDNPNGGGFESAASPTAAEQSSGDEESEESEEE